MRSHPLIALPLAALFVVAACSSGGAATPTATASVPASATPAAPAAPGTLSATDLDGRTFIVTGTTGHDLVPGTQVTLVFKDGNLGVHAGCNQMSGAYTITDGKLKVGPMAMTEMACQEPLMAQDTWVAAFLPGATIALDGDTLTLARDGVTLTATDKTVVTPDLPLEGTTWTVDGLVANEAVSSVPAGVTATLVFAGGKVAVNTGCNKGSGTAAIADTSISFGPIATTKMACAAPAMAVEQQVLQVLSGEVAYIIDADALQLRGAGGGLDLRGKP